MKTLPLLTASIALLASGLAHSAIITHGNLVTDDTTNFITDTVTGRQYLRFDTFDLTYSETVAATSVGGIYEGWSIATSEIADEFYSAALGSASTPCTGATAFGTLCGTMSNWNVGDFGTSYSALAMDYFWYLSTQATPNRPVQEAGLAYISSAGGIYNYDDWYSASGTNSYFGSNAINALLYQPSPVPVPAAVWLFGSGLIGLMGFARRKRTS